MSACDRCPLKGRTRVNFEGPMDAKLAVLGECAAYTEVRLGRPFVGNSGKLLDDMLTVLGIPRSELRVGNVLLCGPIDSDKHKLMETPPPKEEVYSSSMFELALACCAERREEEGDLQQDVVLALGVSAAWGLLGRRITLAGKHPQRGAMFRDWKKRVIFPTWHPSMLLQAGGAKGGDQKAGKTSDAEADCVAHDLRKAWQFANGQIEEFKFFRCPPEDTVDFCKLAKQNGHVGIDIEADSADALTCNLTIVGLSTYDKTDLLALTLKWDETTEEQREAVKTLLLDPEMVSDLQNAPYDRTVLERYDMLPTGKWYDTLLLHNAVAPECDHELQALSCNHIVTNPWKSEYYAREAVRRRKGVKDWEDEMQYNAHDVAATYAITPKLIEECENDNVLQVAEMDTQLSEIARHMRKWGVPVDTEKRDQIGVDLHIKANESRDRIVEMLVDALYSEAHPIYAERFLKTVQKTKRLSLASPYQLATMMDLLEVQCDAVTKTGKRSTKNEVIATINHPFARALLDYRAAEKLISTFVEGVGLKLGQDGRIHPDWKVHGAVTGRWSATPAMMNWKKFLRSMVRAREGRILVGADEAQLEFRIIALLAGQEDLLEALSDPSRDVHSENAARLYPHVWKQLSAHAEQSKARMAELETLMASASSPLQRRQYETSYTEAKHLYDESKQSMSRLRELTKRATYASLYGSTADNLYIKLRSDEKLRSMGMEIEHEQCVYFVTMFPKLWPKIEQWRQQAVVLASRNCETVSALMGRRRPFPLGKFDATQAVNYPVQAFAADLVDMCTLDLWNRVDRSRDWLIIQLHDALVFETDEDRAEELAALVTETMTSVVELNGFKCLFPAEAKIGKSWDKV